MRIVIIVLIVIAVAFAAVAVLGGRRSGGVASDGAPPQKDGKIDEDALGDWNPPGTATMMANIAAPFAPKLKLANPHIAMGPHDSDSRMVPSSTSKMRVARVQLTNGAGMLIEYDCVSKDGRDCPETVCICAPDAVFTSLQIGNCPDGWRKKRLDGDVCTADDAKTSLVIYPEAGALGFAALGEQGVTAEVK